MSPVFHCRQCDKWFDDPHPNVIVSCTVLHPAGGCCHYGYREVGSTMAPLGAHGFPEDSP